MNEWEKNDITDDSVAPTPKKRRISRKWRFGTIAFVTTAVVVAVVILLNVVMDTVEERFPLTVDLTAEGTFTLSDESIQLAKGVEKPVEIVVFTAESFFSAPNTGVDMMDTVLTQFYQTIKQYQAQSDGNVTYRFVDLDANPTLAAKYEAYGIESGSILFLCGERYQTITLYDLYDYDGSQYEGYTYTSEVERVIAAKVNLVSASTVKKVVMLTGHEEMDEIITSMDSVLTANGCDVEQLDITASSEPPEDVGVFVIPAAGEDYSADEIARLRKWLDNNGKRERDLVVLFDWQTRTPNLQEMLADEYGLQVLDQVVCETDANNVFNMNMYYSYADVADTDFTADLTEERALMPATRPINVTVTDSKDESMYGKALITFGETAKVQDLAKALSTDSTDETEAEPVAAEEYPLVGAAYTTDRLYDNNDNRYYTTDVMVFGSAMFAYSQTMDVSSACNEELFLNTFRGLTGLESVISVSNKTLGAETLDFSGSLVPAVLGIGVFTIGLPAILIIVAIVVFVRRRRL